MNLMVIKIHEITKLLWLKLFNVIQQVALLCLAAAVTADADADAQLYGYNYGYNYGYPAYAYNNYGYNAYGYGHASPYASAIGYGAGAAHSLGKREAEAEPSVLPYVAAPYAAAPYAYNPYYYAYAPVASSYQHVATPNAAYNVHQLHKREAEAEASVLPYAAAPYVAAPYAYNPYYYAYAPVASSYQHVATPNAAYNVHQLHKREAEPQGVAVHPGFATSSTFRSPQGAGAAVYGYPSVYGYGYGYPTYGYGVYGYNGYF